MPAPAQRAAARVEGPHRAVGAVDPVVVGNRGADDHEIADHGRRRGFLIFAAPRDIGDAVLEIDLSGVAEIGAGLAGRRIQREQPCIDRGEENPLTAGANVGGLGIRPKCHAPIHQTLGVMLTQVDLGVEIPSLPTGFRIEREHAIEGSGEIHRAGYHDWRGLEFAFRSAVGSVGNVPGMNFPCRFELGDIGRVDPVQRRIAASSGIARVGRPISDGSGRFTGCEGGSCRHQANNSEDWHAHFQRSCRSVMPQGNTPASIPQIAKPVPAG